MNRLLLMVLGNLPRIPGLYGKLCRYAKHPDRYPEAQRWAHIQTIAHRAVEAGRVKLEVTGTENVPRQGGCMLYGNHQGLFDVVALIQSSPIPLGMVYKKELEHTPVLKEVFACTHSYPMDRENVRQSLQVIGQVTRQVKDGRSYMIFPEGTRSKLGNRMLPFHGGSFRCAIKAQCPVVPVVFVDSYKVLDQKGSAPVTVQLHYLKPIPYEEFSGMKAAELAQLVQDRIQEKLDQYA